VPAARDANAADLGAAPRAPIGRRVVVVIGVDDYQCWGRLKNAVNDARGVNELFRQVGFEEIVPPLTNGAATFVAIRRLVMTDLKHALREDDSLVLFFAGHGYTETAYLQGTPVRVGYIIPADGDAPGGDVGTWLELESWLRDVSRLPARHVLVILDSCHSGMALELSRTRGSAGEPYDQLLTRRSRRVITSAQDNQQAFDDGPTPGHSLFTGLLLQALQGDIVPDDRVLVTGTELAIYLQRRVGVLRSGAQTPDFGALPLDAGGDLVLSLVGRTSGPQATPHARDGRPGAADPSRAAARRRWAPLGIALTATLVIGAVIAALPPRRRGQDAHDLVDASDSRRRPGQPIDAGIAVAGTRPGDAAASHHDPVHSSVPHPIYCHRLETGGFALGQPRCAGIHCARPDNATRSNALYQQMKCDELCTCQ
jgi:caspase domain-containing protein